MARLSTALKKMPSEIRAMRFRHARELLDYWRDNPPEHELVALMARAYTSWEPASVANMTEEQVQEQNQRSVERRWKAGQALNPRQLFEALGGGKIAIGSDGVYRNADGTPIPGVHRHPGLAAENHV